MRDAHMICNSVFGDICDRRADIQHHHDVRSKLALHIYDIGGGEEVSTPVVR